MKIEKIKVGFLRTNCYLVIKDNFCIIIDPGDEAHKINKKIEDNNLEVLGIFITHYHFDHIGALFDIKNKYKVKVYDYNIYENDNKEYNIGPFKFKMIETTGHKDDLVTFYFEEDKIMFTGDFLFKDTIGRCDLEGSDINCMKCSIDKIKKYDDNIKIYPGHGNNTTLGYEKNNNIYFLNTKSI